MNKVVVVTGGSRGIGEAIVRDLALNGYTVVLGFNTSEDRAKLIQSDLQEKGKTINIFKADLTNCGDAEALIKFAINTYGKIDVLINNAGISQTKLFTDLSNDDWNNMILTNLTSIFYTTRIAAKYMINQKSGCIINISSIWGEIGASCEVHYSASKAGVIGMTKALAKELGPSNIHVNCISPGIIDTSMNQHLTTEDLEQIKNEIPLCKIGSPNAIANCIKWLINDDYTTGQNISINGGWAV